MQILDRQFADNLPFAAYREPGAERISVLMQHDRQLHRIKRSGPTGFVMVPFNSGDPGILLRPDALDTLESPPSMEFPEIPYPTETDSPGSKTSFLKKVEKAREFIGRGEFEKVVLSRKIQIPSGARPIEVFRRLLQAYPDAFCYLWFHPDTGCWLGASPELLLSVKGAAFKTSALAGTLKAVDGLPAWGAKERREQAYVTNYISDILRDMAASCRISQPESVRAGGLWHLRSNIDGTLGRATAGELLEVLHPTPAVGGLPLKPALKFIRENEGYDRSYYTGYLGLISGSDTRPPHRSMAFYVNLRCLHMQDGVASLYVGAGITSGSGPEREWQETCDKAGTMLRVLFNSAE